MPSHPERVRRNYHNIIIRKINRIQTDDTLIQIQITKLDIASRMSLREVRRSILTKIDDSIKVGYKE